MIVSGARQNVQLVMEQLHPSTRDIVEESLLNHPNPQEVSQALAFLGNVPSNKKGSFVVRAALIGAQNVVAQLAKRNQSAYDDTASVNRLAPVLSLARNWAEIPDISHRRGQLGEIMRENQLKEEHPGKHVESGLRVSQQPAFLRSVVSWDEALQRCIEYRQNPGRLVRYKTHDGAEAFTLLLTEIDMMVAEKTAKGIRPTHFENVKAGIDSADTARKQNRVAQEALVNPDARFLRLIDGKLVDVSATIERGAAVADALITRTVGPPEDGRYDCGLPLSAGDITRYAESL